MLRYSLRFSSLIGCLVALMLGVGSAQACGDQSRIIRTRSLERGIFRSPLDAKGLVRLPPWQQLVPLPRKQQTAFPAAVATNLIHSPWRARELPYQGDRNERAGCRGSALADGEDGLRALVPSTGYGLTVAAAPTFFFYVPETVELPIEFTLLTAEGDVIYQITFTLPKEAGIVPIDLAALTNSVSLQVGQLYYWFFAIVTDPEDRSGDHLVSGWVERVEPDPSLRAASGSNQSQELPLRYAQLGIWYDALAAIAKLHRTYADRSEYTTQWNELLESIGFPYLANEPFLEIHPLPSTN